jgi:hypothetical protein
MMKRWILAGVGVAISVAAAAVMYRPSPPAVPAAVRPLDGLAPEGAVLYIEARDFSGLLKRWNSAPEKAAWLGSDSHSAFGQSRLFLRLEKFFGQFGAAVGVPADTEFVTAAAGGASALALYDIGKIQFVYITHLQSGNFVNSALWQTRNKFQMRLAGGMTYFLRNDEESKQVVTFAVVGDYLVLATREDLMLRTLQLLDNEPVRSLSQDPWYSAAVASAPKTQGDLRMVLNMKKIGVEPHFRTYWVQQNLTEMQSYAAAVSDLYCRGNVYREERVLLRKKAPEHDDPTQKESTHAVGSLLRMTPSAYGFYRAQAAGGPQALQAFLEAILPGQGEPNRPDHAAPKILLNNGEVGNAHDLETRIDIPSGKTMEFDMVSPLLTEPFEQAGPVAYLELQNTLRDTDGVLLSLPELLVVAAARPWDEAAIQRSIQAELAPALSVSDPGFQWHKANAPEEYFELEGLHPLYLAVRGRFLYVSHRAEMLAAALRAAGGPAQEDGLTYAAGFNHAREGKNFVELASILDRTPGPAKKGGAPQFFSGSIGGLSLVLDRLESETVTEREENDKLFQILTYTWSR